jgi:hypothetical protein
MPGRRSVVAYLRRIDEATAKRGGEKIHAAPPNHDDSQHADKPGGPRRVVILKLARRLSLSPAHAMESRRGATFPLYEGAIRTGLRASKTLEDFGGQLFAVR